MLNYPDMQLRRGGAAISPSAALRWAKATAELLLVSVAAMVPYLVVYRPWGGRARTPIDPTQDAGFHAMVVKTMVLRGGFRSTPDLGAPFGQHLSDFPLGADHLHLLALRLLTLVESDPFVVLNQYYAASFLLVALSAYVVGRALGLRPLLATGVAVLFAYLPFHFWHHSARIFLSAYYAVPLTVLLAVWVAEDAIPWPRRVLRDAVDREPGSRARLAAAAACVLVIGSASPYYAVFAVATVGVIGLLGSLRARTVRSLLSGVAVVAGIAVVLLANLAPDLLWRARNGTNDQVAVRAVAEVDRGGLRLAQMILPAEDNRLGGVVGAGPAARPTQPAEDSAYLGLVGATGLVLAIGTVLTGALGSSRFEPPQNVRALSATAMVAVLLGTVGGGSLLIAALGFTQIRTWSRITLVAGFCALSVLGLCVQHLTRRVWSGPAAPVVALLAIAVVGAGLVEQVPTSARPRYAAIASEQRATRALVARMEAALPHGAMVFQLPVVEFPEGGHRADQGDYDQLKGYLAGTGHLRWSYGGVKGRAADWQRAWADQPVPRMLEGLVAAGFLALYVDRFGYEDRGARLDAAVRAVTAGPVGQSADGRLRWYDLRPLATRVEQRLGPARRTEVGRAVLTSPSYHLTAGAFPEEVDMDGRPFRWIGPEAALRVSNPAGGLRLARLRFLARSGEEGTLRLRGDGIPVEAAVATTGTTVDLELLLRPGVTRWTLSYDGQPGADGDPRDLRLQLVDLVLTDAMVERNLPLPPPR